MGSPEGEETLREEKLAAKNPAAIDFLKAELQKKDKEIERLKKENAILLRTALKQGKKATELQDRLDKSGTPKY